MAKEIRIALAGNPNCGKTTLFNALTGSNQFVGNWPGVTVEKKEGKLKNHDGVVITDLPGIYSLSPYTLEEVVTRDYLVDSRPDAILNIVDGSNLERNLYLTTQLSELGIPVVVAVNMMDVVKKNGDTIRIPELSRKLGCPVVEISALKGDGVQEAAEAALAAAKSEITVPRHIFSGEVEHTLAHIEEATLHSMPLEQQRWYAIKIFERDEKVLKKLNIAPEVLAHIEEDIAAAEKELDDDAESIITDARYVYITTLLKDCYLKKNAGKLTQSDKIDRIVTNRWLALPIFAAVMFVVYYVAVSTVGAWTTDWVNDRLFGDGWRLFGIGAAEYQQAAEDYAGAGLIAETFEMAADKAGVDPAQARDLSAEYIYDDGNVKKEMSVTYDDYMRALSMEEPDEAAYGLWIPGIPALIAGGLERIRCAPWLQSLILDGIVAGVGSVLSFVPQMLILFLFLGFLEACGYMSRIAFMMDKIFRKFGLSGKSFIPMLIGVGCSVPAIMASRTIENERDRRMTVMTTSFIPCGAKLPIIALIAGAMFGGAAWVAPSAYFLGIFAIAVSGIILKKTKLFSGNPAPFIMELPAYHMPTFINLLRSMWERGYAFIKKAGTVILLASIVIWFASNYGFSGGSFGKVDMNESILAATGNAIAWIFTPLGWGNWQSAVAMITGLIAKENVVSTFGVLFGGFEEVAEDGWQIWAHLRQMFTPLAAYAFLIFNLLCAPCVAAMGAIRREMNSGKWTAFAIGYQCLFAYMIALIVYQLGMLFGGSGSFPGAAAALLAIAVLCYLLFRPFKEATTLKLR
ncbi:MAG: ferrous iron transport protein B [Firmicutes bacterium]|nr:ferrous iron transport protein B [Bacillota bacterium]